MPRKPLFDDYEVQGGSGAPTPRLGTANKNDLNIVSFDRNDIFTFIKKDDSSRNNPSPDLAKEGIGKLIVPQF